MVYRLPRLAEVCFYRNDFTYQNRAIRVMDIPSWLSGEVIFVLAFLIVVGVSAMAVHRYRERASWREREGAMLRPPKRHVGELTKTEDRMEQITSADKITPDALGWVPAPNKTTQTIPTEQTADEPAAKPAKTILIADDDPVIAFALKKRLQRLGYEVLRSPDSAHALLGAMKINPDLVILDVNMPGGNGLAVCEMMATDPASAAIPVIVHTTRNDEETKTRCKELGAIYVQKSHTSWEEIQAIAIKLLGGNEAEDVSSRPVWSEEDPKLTSATCGQSRVLCVEGENHQLKQIEQRLAALGVEVLETNDLDEGFWTCFSEKPHVVLIYTDLPLPEIQAALYRLSQHPVTRDIPIVIIKGRTVDAADLTRGLSDTKNIQIVDASFGWDGVRRELAKIISIGESDKAETFPEMTQPFDNDDQEEGKQKFIKRSDRSGVDESENPLKFLCIDDDPVIAKSIALRVQPYGIELKEAANGTQGFYLGLRERPDLILLDLKMPEGDGQYVLGKFRSHPLTKDIPIIVLTVESNTGVRRKLTSVEMVGYLSKPVRWKEFFEEVGRFIDLPEKLMSDYKLPYEGLIAHAPV